MPDKTALFESSQALFCSIADNLGMLNAEKTLDIKKYPSYSDFKNKNSKLINQSVKRVESPGVSLKEMDTFLLANNDWYISSVLIAVELIKEITKIDPNYQVHRPGYQNMFYLRGDKDVMDTIQKLFTIANKAPITIKNQAVFGNINKWSPADIYLASKVAKEKLSLELKKAKPKSYTFQNLNILTSDLIDSGDLLPLSLKKTTKSVQLQQVNFDRKQEVKMLKGISFKKTTDWKPYKRVAFGQKTETRDMRILLNNGGDVKLRHDPSAKRFVAEAIFSKAEARGGSIGSMKVLSEIIHFVNPDIAKQILDKYKKGEQKYFDALKKIEYLRKDKPRFDFERGAISAIYVINEVMPVLKKFFKENKKDEGNKVLRLMFEYITSRTPLSGKFVIAK